eukprot:4441156-Amphidinium_carterae.1
MVFFKLFRGLWGSLTSLGAGGALGPRRFLDEFVRQKRYGPYISFEWLSSLKDKDSAQTTYPTRKRPAKIVPKRFTVDTRVKMRFGLTIPPLLITGQINTGKNPGRSNSGNAAHGIEPKIVPALPQLKTSPSTS